MDATSVEVNDRHLTVGSVLESVDARLLRLANPEASTNRPIGEVVLFDTDTPIPAVSNGVLLLIGSRSIPALLIEQSMKAVEYGYAAVVVKIDGADVIRNLDESIRRRIPILVASEYISWRQVDAIFASAMGSQGQATEPNVGAEPDKLHSICNALASLIGGSVVIETLEQHVLAYSSIKNQRIDTSRKRSILERQVPDLAYHREQYLKVLMSSAPVTFESRNRELPRMAVAVRSGKMPLGTIWAIEGAHPFTDEHYAAMEQAAQVVALHILRSANTGELDSRIRSNALAEALSSSQVQPHAREALGLDASGILTLVALASAAKEDWAGPVVAHVGVEVRRYLAAFSPATSSAVLAQAVYLLIPDSSENARRLVGGLKSQVEFGTGTRLKAALSDQIDELTLLPRYKAQTDAILRAIRARGTADVATLAEVRLEALINQVSDIQTREPLLRDPTAAVLAAHDKENGSEYTATLLAWCMNLFDISAAAEQLNIHSNSLRYRLSRVRDICGIDLEDPRQVLPVWVQLLADGYQNSVESA